MIKMISAMKLAKDKMDSPLSVAEIQKYVDKYKSIGATHVEVATVMGHPNFQSYSKAWADTIHNAGLGVTWRNAHQNMEGLYSAPKYVGGNRKPEQWWIDESVKAAQLLGTSVKSGDEWAIFPERTEGIFDDNTAFLALSGPNTYTDFFVKLHEACKAVLPAGVKVGLSANNASELFSGWLPRTLSDKYGVSVIDHYVDGDPTRYEADVRNVFTKYGKQVYVQEGAPDRFNTPDRVKSDAYYAVNKKLEAEGILYGFGSWSGWIGNPESTITDTGLTPNGESLKAWWGGTSTPTPVPPTTGTIELSVAGNPALEPYSVVAKTTHTGVVRVEFNVDGRPYSVESNPPYSLFGDDGTTIVTKTLGNGVHTIVANVFSTTGLLGTKSLTITEGTTTPTPLPTPPPTTDLAKIVADLIVELASLKKLSAIRAEVYSTHTASAKVTEIKRILQ